MDVAYSPSADIDAGSFSVMARDIHELSLAQREISHVEKLVNTVGELVNAGGWSLEVGTNKLSWTAQTCIIHGLLPGYQPSLEEAINFYHPDDLPKVEQAVNACIENGDSFDIELRLITAKKTQIWTRSIGYPVYEKGVIVSVYGAFQDITTYRELTNLRKTNQTMLEDTASLSKVGGWSLEVGTEKLSITKEIYSLIGISEESGFSGEQALQLFYPEDRPLIEKYINQCIKEAVAWDYEHRLLRDNGDTIWVRSLGKPEVVEGKVVKLQGMLQDITDRKIAEQKQKQLTQRYQQLVEGTNVLSWEADINTFQFTYMSPQAEKITGFSTEQWCQPDFWIQHLHPEDRDGAIKYCQTRTESLEDHSFDYRFIKANGEVVWIHDSVKININAVGTPTKLQGVMLDITAAKLSEQKIQRVDRALRTLVDINQAIVMAKSESELINAICKLCVEEAGYVMAWYGEVEHNQAKTIRPVAQFGSGSDSYLQEVTVTWDESATGQGPSGRAVRSKETQIARGNTDDLRQAPWENVDEAYGYWSSITVPVMADDEVLAVINLYSDRSDAFDENEVNLLSEMAGDMGFGIKAQRLSVSQQDYADRLSRALFQAVSAFALTVEKRDPYTAGHMGRVAELAAAIGAKLDLSAEEIQGLRLVATIHDLGKIYAPSEILNRPGKLTAPEFDIIKSHSQVDYDILKGIEFPWPVADIVLQHHERLDGSGYPNGLKGSEILLEAQIIAVADVVEAITSHRPYRAALGSEVALNEIQLQSGKGLSAQVVDACLEVFNVDKFEFKQDL